jgi:hypothetical protein
MYRINISDIAPLIGESKYNVPETFEKLWVRYGDLNKVRAMMIDDLGGGGDSDSDGGTSTINQTIEEVKLTQTQKLKRDIGLEIVKKIQDTNVETDEKAKALETDISNLSLPEPKRMEIQKSVTSLLNKTHGIANETSGIELFEKRYNVKLDTSQTLYSKPIPCDDDDWIMLGRMDGICSGDDEYGDYIVEIKNRRARFFNTVYGYEMVQLQMYLWISDNSIVYLAECLNGKLNDIRIERDEDYIENILQKVSKFVSNFKLFLSDYTKQKEYLISCTCEKDKKRFIEKFIL